jgi:uncharacterized membrane protein
MKFEDFLTPVQEQEIADTIDLAESGTTGEIRVHIERRCKEEPLHRAISLFGELNMHETRHKNGVLIYISIDDHKLAIYGDEGIHSIVGDEFWNEDINIMVSCFRDGHYVKGIKDVVGRVGEKLAIHFPADGSENPNELDNSISFGDNS